MEIKKIALDPSQVVELGKCGDTTEDVPACGKEAKYLVALVTISSDIAALVEFILTGEGVWQHRLTGLCERHVADARVKHADVIIAIASYRPDMSMEDVLAWHEDIITKFHAKVGY